MAALGWGLLALILGVLILVCLWLAGLVNAMKKRDGDLVVYHVTRAAAVNLFVGVIIGVVVLVEKIF